MINTYYRWAWSPSYKTLNYDFVRQKRSTWGGDNDDDMFYSTTSAYSAYNATHIVHVWSVSTRTSYDNGRNVVDGSADTDYYWR